MVDAVISPSGNKQWTIYEKPGDKDLGYVVHDRKQLTIMAAPNNMLTGLSLGPYATKEDAMDAIAKKLGGSCGVGFRPRELDIRTDGLLALT